MLHRAASPFRSLVDADGGSYLDANVNEHPQLWTYRAWTD